jgi:hypothetical protein
MTCRPRSRISWLASVVTLTLLLPAVASAQTAETAPPAPPAPTLPAQPSGSTPMPTDLKPVLVGPAREMKLGENTWFRFGAQVQGWYKASQDRIKQPDGSDGGYQLDFFCRRCRLWATGSVVKDVVFNILFEASNLGKANADGSKNFAAPQFLDAYVQGKFSNYFLLSIGNILLPNSRNGTQPTTTYLSLDNANVDTSAVAQGNTAVLRDMGIQANGFFLEDHLEYRLGAFQGSRAGPTATQTAGHNGPRVIAMLQYNLWDTEKGYVNGGHYYGTKQVLGLFASFDYQTLRKADPILGGTTGAGVPKNAFMGLTAAAFINYPLNGKDAKGADEIVGLVQYGMYDGGMVDPAAAAGTAAPTYPLVPKQTNLLVEAAYYNKGLSASVFGKYEFRAIDGGYSDAIKAATNVNWIAFGLKYYFAPANMYNIGLQFERTTFGDANLGLAAGAVAKQEAVNSLAMQIQMVLY